jgi:2Fe-2S ferredoxin
MPKVTYIEHNGTAREVEVPVGLSVMRGAVNNGVPGIDADCGGECACATCHVYVDERCIDRVPAPDSVESELLEGVAAERRPNSRLSCQITMTSALAGLVVHMPERQT